MYSIHICTLSAECLYVSCTFARVQTLSFLAVTYLNAVVKQVGRLVHREHIYIVEYICGYIRLPRRRRSLFAAAICPNWKILIISQKFHAKSSRANFDWFLTWPGSGRKGGDWLGVGWACGIAETWMGNEMTYYWMTRAIIYYILGVCFAFTAVRRTWICIPVTWGKFVFGPLPPSTDLFRSHLIPTSPKHENIELCPKFVFSRFSRNLQMRWNDFFFDSIGCVIQANVFRFMHFCNNNNS